MRILVTGGAGLVGRALIARLAARGHVVSGVIHRAAPPAMPGAVTWLPGDVRGPGLGLPASALAGLDLVVHCAAVTGFSLPAETYRAVNVRGTAHVVALAQAARARLLHVSTAYVCGDRDGPIAEHELWRGQRFANGYEASKAEAEALVATAGGAIARPSIVAGAWADGAIAAFGGFYVLLRLIASGRIETLPIAPGAAVDLVPIDHLVGGLVDLAERIDRAAGQTFHLVSAAPVAVATLCDMGRGYPQFRIPRLVAAGAAAPAGQPPLLGAYASYLERAPRFAAHNLARLSGRTCPPTDAAYVRRIYDHAVRAGFLPAEHTFAEHTPA